MTDPESKADKTTAMMCLTVSLSIGVHLAAAFTVLLITYGFELLELPQKVMSMMGKCVQSK